MLIPTRPVLGCLSAMGPAAICYSGGAPRLLHTGEILPRVPLFLPRELSPSLRSLLGVGGGVRKQPAV